MRRILAAVVGATLALPAAASAQQLAFTPGAPGSARHVTIENLVVHVAGQVSVSFHPDAATGCASLAGCAYSGTLTWIPNGGSGLELARYEQHHRKHVQAILGFGVDGPGSLTASTVERSGGGQCADEQVGFALVPATEHGGRQTFTLEGAIQPTRCAGPLPADLAAVLPRVTVTSRRLEAGHLRLDFRSRRTFAAHGFAGTLTSTLAVTVGGLAPASVPPPGLPPEPPAPRSKPMRIVTETLRVASVSGSLDDAIAGSSNSDVCVLLDACGLSGTLTLAPRPTLRQAHLIVTGPASRPYRDFLTALGLSRAGRAAGLPVFGVVQWNDSGTLTEAVHQSAACSDSVRLAAGMVNLALTRRRVEATYGVLGDFATGNPLRTRCPGPAPDTSGPLATGSVARSSLGKRTFTITLRGNGTLGDEGYALRPGGAITLELRRGRVHQIVERVPSLIF